MFVGPELFAGTVSLLGPEKYVCATEDPLKITKTFNVSAPSVSYMLVVQNGDPGQGRSVSSSTLKLNGIRVIGPRDLDQQTTEVRKRIALAAKNQLSIEVQCDIGASITVQILGIDGNQLTTDSFDPADCARNPNQLACQNTLTYTGQPFDSESGLYYMGARFYDPQTGRFITRDPATDLSKYHDYFPSTPGGTIQAGSQIVPTATVSQPSDAQCVIKTESGLEPCFGTHVTPDPMVQNYALQQNGPNAAAWDPSVIPNHPVADISFDVRPQYVHIDRGTSYPAADPFVPDSWNSYAYARNSPANYSDPMGLDAMGTNVISQTDMLAKDIRITGLDVEFPLTNEAAIRESSGNTIPKKWILQQSLRAGSRASVGMYTGETPGKAIDNLEELAGMSNDDKRFLTMYLAQTGFEQQAAVEMLPSLRVYASAALEDLDSVWQSYQANPLRELGAIKFGGSGLPSSRALARNLENSGIVRPPETAAHHIVAGSEPLAAPARRMLSLFNVDINAAENGVFLPDRLSSGAPGAYHRSLHTGPYYDEVNFRTSQATTHDELMQIMNDITQELLANKFPR